MSYILNKLGFGDPNDSYYVYAPKESNEQEVELKELNTEGEKQSIDPSKVFIVNPKEYSPLNSAIAKIGIFIGGLISIAGLSLFYLHSSSLLNIGYALAGNTLLLSSMYMHSRLTLAKIAEPGVLKELTSLEKKNVSFAIFEKNLLLKLDEFQKKISKCFSNLQIEMKKLVDNLKP